MATLGPLSEIERNLSQDIKNINDRVNKLEGAIRAICGSCDLSNGVKNNALDALNCEPVDITTLNY